MGKTHRKRKMYFEDEFEDYSEHNPKNREIKEHNHSRERKRRERVKDDQAAGEERGLYYLQRSKPH